ncbi:MAG: aminoglycoside phosphotransferase family protein [Egibacteraceae bacterium]
MTGPAGILGQTLATEFVVGSNASGTAGGNWPFLLPTLQVGRVLCCGAPTLASLRTLSGIAEDVVVSPTRSGRALAEAARREGLGNVRACDLAALTAGTVDVAWVGRRASAALLDRLDLLLRPEGLLFANVPTAAMRSRFSGGQTLWTAPRRHDVHLAVPLPHGSVIDWARRGGLAEATRGRLARRGRRRLAVPTPMRRPPTRRAALLGRPGMSGLALPAYVLRIAEEAGVPIQGRPWAFWAPGRYASKKILFFVFDQAGERPDIIVRLTRHPALNHRLENEWRALRRLERIGVGDAETLPRPRFFGWHQGLAILGETAIQGVAFQGRSRGGVDCPYGRAMIDWLVDLGVRTADRTSFGPSEIAGAVSALHDRFTATYQLRPDHARILADHVAALCSKADRLPAVMQHGDPGTWNLMVTPAGRVGILDWEACEQHGMPLWDIFYFLRSYGVWASRVAGTRDQLRGCARQFFDASPRSELAASAVERFCERAGLSGQLVEPLFFTCWMHRALKEATRLRPGRVNSGHFVRLLRRCLQERRSPGLRRLFSVSR